MSDVIRLLPDSVANQIAAGEVIQRPASVVKELVENAVDAGATEINIYIKDAGRTLIQVIDNGRGMSETDARLAFERHATSKIRGAEDLFSLTTMGFRGEALPSICAISQVELKTQREEDEIGTRLLINGSKVESQEKCVCSKGSNFMVKNIFFNVPARRKFLKSDAVEQSNIIREFERLALVNHNIRMSIDTGGKVYDLRPGTFKQRIGDIWKNNLNLQLLPLDIETSMVKITGFISRPEFARRRNALQYLFVNGRHMKHPAFHKAIVSAYDELIASDTQPCYFVRFDVDPNSIDVNIHPTKSEIKFEDEKQIWSLLKASVKGTLGKFSAIPQIDFTSDPMPFSPAKEGDFVKAPALNVDSSYNPFKNPYEISKAKSEGSNGRNISQAYRPTKIDTSWEKLYDSFVNKHQDDTQSMEKEFCESQNLVIEQDGVEQKELIEEKECLSPLSIQYADKYIVAASKEGLMVIDQYRAHVKILYEKYMSKAMSGLSSSQRLMFPECIELDSTQQLLMEEIEDDMQRLGFILEYEGDNKWNVCGLPPLLEKMNPKDIIFQILESLLEQDDDVNTSIMQRVALVMARSSAIRGGQTLNAVEMEHIIAELFMLKDPMYSPTGKSIIKIIGEDKIRTLFQ